jgi:AAA family ATP:ADP antiporter
LGTIIVLNASLSSLDELGTTRGLKPVLFVSFAAFFLLSGYEFVRSPSNTLFQKAYGAENFALVMSFLPVMLIIAVGGYNLLLTRLKPRKTLLLITLLSAFLLAACQQAIVHGFVVAAAILYLLRETYVTLILEQYWSYLDSVQKESEAKRNNSIFMGMVSLGAMLGGFIVSLVAQKIGTVTLPLMAALTTLPAAVLAHWAFRYTGEPAPEVQTEAAHEMGVDRFGIEPFRKIPALRSLFLLVLCSQGVSTIFYLMFQKQLQISLPSSDAQTAFSGMFYASLNALSLVFQFIITPLVLRRVSKRAVQLMIPSLHIATAVLFILRPGIETAAIAFALFKSLDYSLFRSSKELLYLPLSFDARYRAKEWIDVVGYRISKGGTSLGLVVLQKIGLMGPNGLPFVAFGACAAWVYVAGRLTKKQGEPAAAPLIHPV